jgi:hypothetical protein
MTQQMASTLIYGNTAVNPERFTGLAPRYNTVSHDHGPLSRERHRRRWHRHRQHVDLDRDVGRDTTVGITPAGKPTGLQHNDMGKQRVQDV